MDAVAQFDLFDTVLDGALQLVINAESGSGGRLSDEQRFSVVWNAMMFWAWSQEPPKLMWMAKQLLVLEVMGFKTEYKEFFRYLEVKYGLRPTEEGAAPIQQFIIDCDDLAKQIEKRRKEGEMN